MQTAHSFLQGVLKSQFKDMAYLYQEYLSRLLLYKDPIEAEESILANLRTERIDELTTFISDTLGEIRTMDDHEWGLIEHFEGLTTRFLKQVIARYESEEDQLRNALRSVKYQGA